MIKQKVQLKLQNLVYKQLVFPQLTELVIFTAIFFLYKANFNKKILIPWYVLSMVLCIGRYLLTSFHNKHPSLQLSKHWRYVLKVLAFTSGFSWGVIGSMLMPTDIYHQVLVVFLIIGAVAVGNLFYYPIKNLYLYYLIPAYFPHVAWLFSQGGSYTVIGYMAITYSCLMLIISINGYKMVLESATLQFQNVALVKNLTKAKKQLEKINEKLAQEASCDALTSLPNRKSMDLNLSRLIEISKKNQGYLAVLFCDLDRFKMVNDNYGHDIGDKLLVEVSKRLKNVLDESDVLARLGGDEFIIILNNIQNLAEIEVQAKKIIDRICEYFPIDKHKLSVGISIGISVYPYDAKDKNTLLKYADYALYQAKAAGRCQFVLYSNEESHS